MTAAYRATSQSGKAVVRRAETDHAVIPSAAGLNADGRTLGVAVQPVS